MVKFKFEVLEFINLTEPVTKIITVTADEKLVAFSKIRDMYPAPQYHIKFLGTV